MPLGEIETHPYLALGTIPNATKMILGSFPVYECTDPNLQLKQDNRVAEGTVRFFYGSVHSRLWSKYIAHVDDDLDLPPNPQLILESLRIRGIAISDTISQCERRGFSSSDKDLVNKVYNRQGVRDLITGGVTKILCTSKGVLTDLTTRIITPQGFGHVNDDETLAFQHNFLEGIGGSDNLLQTRPIARAFTIGASTVYALAIPSPGSPQRRITDFGFAEEGNAMEYANSYFENAFSWLTS